MTFIIVLVFLIGYFLGNINGAVAASKLLAHEDVRTKGSGNAGLTNFVRNYGAGSSLLVIVIDVCKAVLACLIGGWILGRYGYELEGRMLGGMAVVVGHIFPMLLDFKGGKGILSGATVAMMVDWRIGLIVLALFAVLYLVTQYVSLGSVMAAATFAVLMVVLHYDNFWVMICGALTGSLVVWMHRENIKRLLKGEERKTNLFKGKGK